MRKLLGIFAILFAVLTLGMQSAAAASVHFKKGSPVFTDQGLVLNAKGSLAGLGHGDVLVTSPRLGRPARHARTRRGSHSRPVKTRLKSR